MVKVCGTPDKKVFFSVVFLEYRSIRGDTGRENVCLDVRWSIQNFILEQTFFRLMPNKVNSPRHSHMGSLYGAKVFLNGTLKVLKENPL